MKEKDYKYHMKRNLYVGYVQSFFSHLLFFYPIWYAFENQFASAEVLTTIYAASHFLTVILELPTGALADLLGRRKTVFMGILFQGLAWIFLGLTQNIWYLWGGYLLSGIGDALRSGADTALYFDSLKELGQEKKYTQFVSKKFFIGRASIIIAVFLGGYLYLYDQRITYYLVGIAYIIASLVTLFATEPKIDSEVFTLQNYIKQTRQGVKQLFKNSYTRILSLYYLLIGGISFYFVYFLNIPFATEKGFSETERSWLLSGAYIAMAVIMYYVTHHRKMEKKHTFLLFPPLLILGFLPGAFVNKSATIFVFVILQFVGTLRWVLLDEHVNREFASRYRATAVSALNMATSMMFIFISLSGTVIIKYFGIMSMMTFLGIISIITLVPVTGLLLMKSRDYERDRV